MDPQQVLSRPAPVPRAAGVYAWYFTGLEEIVPFSGCISCDGFRLLYTGISPSAPQANGKGPSKQSLQHRIRYHFAGNETGHIFRLTLCT